jgi:4-carboxymuconolactone decarboxylase
MSNTESLTELFAILSRQPIGSSLSPRYRELLILQTAWSAESAILWSAHCDVALSVGVTDRQIAAIQQEQIEAYVFSPRDKSLLRFLSRLRGCVGLRAEGLDDLKSHFNVREVVDIIATECIYHATAMLDRVPWTNHKSCTVQ